MLCNAKIPESEKVSHFRVEGDCVGFGCRIDAERWFHDACLTKDEGIDEIARAQVLDYLEAMQMSRSTIENLKSQNLERAKKLLKAIEWRKKYPS